MSQGQPAPTPTIEFACRQCGRPLTIGAQYAGGQVQCPSCKSVQPVPAPGQGPRPAAPPPGGPSGPVVNGGAAPGGATPSGARPATAPPPGGAVAPAPGPRPSAPTSPPPSGPAAGRGGDAFGDFVGLSTASAPASGGQMTETRRLFDTICAEVRKIYVGQDELVLGSLVAIFSGGHVLIESMPGLGKTLFVRTLGKILGCRFGRIQFTADLMPSDITGAPLFDMKTQEFRFRPGPVFTQFLLADEINRAPAKTHAALLEIMQEYRVTVDGEPHTLERPFLVLATQNPVESEGTYALPEAQLDRFMFKLRADYPEHDEEAQILAMHSQQISLERRLDEIATVTDGETILRIQRDSSAIRVDPRLVDYITRVVRLTRTWPAFYLGASPRAGIALMQAARTLAAFRGRDYAVPDDVVEIALPTLRHRVTLTAEAEVEGQTVDDQLRGLLRQVEVPRL